MRIPLQQFVLLSACLASAAFAVTDSVEFQVPANKVLPLVLDRARASIGCIAPFQASGLDLLVDHVEFPSSPTFRRSPTAKQVTINQSFAFTGHPLQVVLPAQVFLKTQSAVKDPAVPQASYVLSPTLSFVFDVTLELGPKDVPQFCIAPTDVESVFPDAAALLPAVQGQVGKPCFPLGLDGLDDFLDGQVKQTAIGVSANGALDTLAIRIEFDHPTPQQAAWQSFIEQGTIAPAPAGTGFALLFDQKLLARVMKARFEQSLQDPAMRIEDPGLKAAFSSGSTPKLDVTFDAQLTVPGCLNTIGAHPVDISLLFGLNATHDAVTTTGAIDWDLVDSDVLLCALADALITGHIGLMFDPVVLSVLGGVAGSIGSIPGDQLPTECSQTDDTHFSCNSPLVIPSLAAGGKSNLRTEFAANDLKLFEGNLAITGTSAIAGVASAAPKATIDDLEFAYGVFGGCNSLHVGTEATFRATGKAEVCNAPMHLEKDPLKVFSVPGLSNLTAVPWDGVAKFGDLVPDVTTNAYWQAPYASALTVLTSGGSRTLALGPLTKPSADEEQATQFEYVAARISCVKLESGWFGIPGKFDPHWLVDPPIDLVAVVRNSFDRTTKTVKVSLSDVVFQVVDGNLRFTGAFSYPTQTVRMTALATITNGRTQTQVPVSTLIAAPMSGSEISRTGLVRAAFPRGAQAVFTLESRSGLVTTTTSFAVDISAHNMGLQGAATR